MTIKETNKRSRLLEAANKLVHAQGFNQTTLADIAREAEVPLGNVYYYFKTKEDIGQALIGYRADFYRGLIAEWDRLPDPKKRIHALIGEVEGQREALAASGCPIGSLCQELHKDGGAAGGKVRGPDGRHSGLDRAAISRAWQGSGVRRSRPASGYRVAGRQLADAYLQQAGSGSAGNCQAQKVGRQFVKGR
jgi:AcrR family transcriptional regulator